MKQKKIILIFIRMKDLGHSDTKITNRQYTQILDELPAIYNKKLDDLIFKDFKI